uniref:Uncharacterized protein n=1 Tax=Oryza punctata TaxID=4537 RepID=A0A0E0LD08_ORYPU
MAGFPMPSIRAALLCMAPAIAVVPLYGRLREQFRPSSTPVAAGDAKQAETTKYYTSSPGFRPSGAASRKHAHPTPIIPSPKPQPPGLIYTSAAASTEHVIITPKSKPPPQQPNKNDALNLKAEATLLVADPQGLKRQNTTGQQRDEM